MRRILISLAAVAMGSGAALAFAGTASAASGTVVFKSSGKVVVQAATGFNNNISVRQVGANILVKDAGDVLIAASGCKLTGAEVSCPAAGVTTVEVSAFDGTDRVAVNIATIATTIRGGEGNDTLFGASNGPNEMFGDGGADTLFGGDQADVLRGGNGDDTLFGFAGNDILSGDGGTDKIFGGTGSDFCIGESKTDCP